MVEVVDDVAVVSSVKVHGVCILLPYNIVEAVECL